MQHCNSPPTSRKRPADDALVDDALVDYAPPRKRLCVSPASSPSSSPSCSPYNEVLSPQPLLYGNYQYVAQPLDLPRAPMSSVQANDMERCLRGVRPVSPSPAVHVQLPRPPMPPQYAARVSHDFMYNVRPVSPVASPVSPPPTDYDENEALTPAEQAPTPTNDALTLADTPESSPVPADVFVFQLAKTTDREAENKLSFAVKRNCIVLPPARKPRPVPGQHVLAVHGDSVSYLGQVKECRPSCVQDRLPVTLDMSRVCCQGALPPSVAYCRTFLAELRNKYHSKCTRWFGHGAMTHGHNTADGAALCTFIHEHFA